LQSSLQSAFVERVDDFIIVLMGLLRFFSISFLSSFSVFHPSERRSLPHGRYKGVRHFGRADFLMPQLPAYACLVNRFRFNLTQFLFGFKGVEFIIAVW